MENNLQQTKSESLLENIGKESILSEADSRYLTGLGRWLYENGFYTKGIYIDALVENSKLMLDKNNG